MKFGIYSEFFAGNTVGGREYLAAVIAELLASRGHITDFIHHSPELTVDEFVRSFGTEESAIRLRQVATRPPAKAFHFLRELKRRQEWERSLSAPYDCFIHIVHANPVRCSAPKGISIILFPFFEPFNFTAGRAVPGYGRSWVWVLSRFFAYRIGWQGRIRSYQLHTSISQYVQRWTKRRWKLETEILYPPSDDDISPGLKEDLILSVGRFNGNHPTMVDKKQLEMAETFSRGSGEEFTTWGYRLIGGAGLSPREQSYLHQVRAALSSNGQVKENASRAELRHSYAAAKIFWHAAGFGNDESVSPELSEHFGIATVDAMKAGCVPIVVNKGGQSELVEHGVSGFLWNTLEELAEHTRSIIKDPGKRKTISEAAQLRAKNFGRRVFERRFICLFEQTFGSLSS